MVLTVLGLKFAKLERVFVKCQVNLCLKDLGGIHRDCQLPMILRILCLPTLNCLDQGHSTTQGSKHFVLKARIEVRMRFVFCSQLLKPKSLAQVLES